MTLSAKSRSSYTWGFRQSREHGKFEISPPLNLVSFLESAFRSTDTNEISNAIFNLSAPISLTFRFSNDMLYFHRRHMRFFSLLPQVAFLWISDACDCKRVQCPADVVLRRFSVAYFYAWNNVTFTPSVFYWGARRWRLWRLDCALPENECRFFKEISALIARQILCSCPFVRIQVLVFF